MVNGLAFKNVSYVSFLSLPTTQSALQKPACIHMTEAAMQGADILVVVKIILFGRYLELISPKHLDRPHRNARSVLSSLEFALMHLYIFTTRGKPFPLWQISFLYGTLFADMELQWVTVIKRQ